MTILSPAAQAVWNAFLDRYEWTVTTEELFAVAAALRAAAEQVVPEEPLHFLDGRWQFERDTRQKCRQQLLSIATELEAQ